MDIPSLFYKIDKIISIPFYIIVAAAIVVVMREVYMRVRRKYRK